MATKVRPGPKILTTKRCKDCYADVLVNVSKCPACGRTIGPPDKQGYAKRPFDWKAYGMAAIGVGAFGYYIWWAFIR